MADEDVEVSPSRTYSRYWVLRVAPQRYYESGGFVVRGGTVSVGQIWSKRVSTVATAQVAAVVTVLVRLRRGDWRVLLVGSDSRVLAQTNGLFYSDDELKRLAGAVGCECRREDFVSYRKLNDRYPGAVRHWWERHFILFGFALGLVLVFGIYGIALLFGAR